ncbi:cytosine deaminase [Franzmannia pantelleriensis]|uniref:Cytosine deaminase n=1 Tax=Franzmannia pantelleriensis TaxID=48727 RepID=A0A1G9PB04_9GAMM|nr:SDR family oxidoreductase [Halomonas pantelleriensis]SDL95345.1 cytosine deaminase [Halomonas pantelleriensis]
MKVVIAGGHGQIAQHVERLLAARGDEAVGLVRNSSHIADIEASGATAVLLDLERASVNELAEVIRGADAVIFAAGAGPGSGAARKLTVDRDAGILLADAAVQAQVPRYVMISGKGADKGGQGEADEVFGIYLDAKKAADDDLISRELDWTIVRPGVLTNEVGTGRVTLAPQVEWGKVAREDVAAVIIEILDKPESAGWIVELVAGETPVTEAVRLLAR